MSAERVSMRRVREILRLKHEGGASDRQIPTSLSLARSTVTARAYPALRAMSSCRLSPLRRG